MDGRTDGQLMHELRLMSEQKLGDFGESVWRNIFRNSGVGYIPLTDIDNGGAPRIESASGATVLPDFKIHGEHWTAFMDSKAKTQSVLFRIKKQVRHGIDRRNYAHYERSAASFRSQCGIGVVELFDDSGFNWSGALLVESLPHLGKPIPGFSNQAHMCYWPRKMFHNMASVSPRELFDVANGQCRKSYRLDLDQVFDRKSQRKLFEPCQP